MFNAAFKKKWGRLALVLGMVIALSGCVKEVATKKDPFFEKWQEMAETARGHSPAPGRKDIDVTGSAQKESSSLEKDVKSVKDRQLPVRKITLKMRQADVKAVIRALARIEEQNILIKDEVKGEITVDFKEVPWDVAFKGILQNQGLYYQWEGNIVRVITLEDKDRELKQKAQEISIQQMQPLLTRVISIDYADAPKLKENLQEFLTKDKDGKQRGSVQVNAHSNSLIIQASRDDLERMMPIINEIDKPTPQILIKANIVETTQDTARNLGISWGGMYSTRFGDKGIWITPGGTSGTGDPISGNYTPGYGGTGLSGQGFAFNAPSQTSITGSGTLGLMFGTIGGNILEMQLNALQKEGKLNILSSPSITTLDNQTAYTENGEKVPYITEETSATGAITRSVKFEDVVLRLEITPHVIDGKNLKMKVVVKKDEVDNSRNVQGNPYIYKKETNTSLIVQDGETIVISGLTKQKKEDAQVGVPLLKDIPLLGWFFKGAGKSESMQEVLIFITPTILPPTQAVSASEKSPVPPANSIQ
ncbi:MAG: type IV pilus secretin PilQ [Syntrophales bacterium]